MVQQGCKDGEQLNAEQSKDKDMDEDQRHKQSNTQYISDIKILILRSSEVIIIENNKILPF